MYWEMSTRKPRRELCPAVLERSEPIYLFYFPPIFPSLCVLGVLLKGKRLARCRSVFLFKSCWRVRFLWWEKVKASVCWAKKLQLLEKFPFFPHIQPAAASAMGTNNKNMEHGRYYCNLLCAWMFRTWHQQM